MNFVVNLTTFLSWRLSVKVGDLVAWAPPTMPNVLTHREELAVRGVGIVLEVRKSPAMMGDQLLRARVLFTPGSENHWFIGSELTLISSYPDH